MSPRLLIRGIVGSVVLMSLLSQAMADTLVYTSGPILDATWTCTRSINPYPAVAESFPITAPTTLTSAIVGLSAYQESPATPTGLTWAIGTFTGVPGQWTSLYSGSAVVTNTFVTSNGLWNAYDSTFSLPAVSLEPGTYWLSVYNAATTDPNHGCYWAISDNTNSTDPASVQIYQNGQCADNYYRLSFSLYAVPEPSTFVMLGVGAIGMLCYVWRRRVAKAGPTVNHLAAP
jgi:hypothetical protein